MFIYVGVLTILKDDMNAIYSSFQLINLIRIFFFEDVLNVRKKQQQTFGPE